MILSRISKQNSPQRRKERRGIIFLIAAEPRKSIAGCKQGRQLKIRNHFVVGFVERSYIYECQLNNINAILPAGLSFFTFWPLSRK
jgi:hypothetical protein